MTGRFGRLYPPLMTGAVMNEAVKMRCIRILSRYPSIRRSISHGVAPPMSLPVMQSTP